MTVDEVLKIVWCLVGSLVLCLLICILVYNMVLARKEEEEKHKLVIKKLKLEIELNEERLQFLRNTDDYES